MVLQSVQFAAEEVHCHHFAVGFDFEQDRLDRPRIAADTIFALHLGGGSVGFLARRHSGRAAGGAGR